MYSPWVKKQDRKAASEGTKGKQEVQFRAQHKKGATAQNTRCVCLMYVRTCIYSK